MTWPTDRPGVPLYADRDGVHWLCISQATGAMMAFQWNAPPDADRVGAWANISRHLTTSQPLDAVRMGLTYVAPCLTPSEVAAAVQAERVRLIGSCRAEMCRVRSMDHDLTPALDAALAQARRETWEKAAEIAEDTVTMVGESVAATITAAIRSAAAGEEET